MWTFWGLLILTVVLGVILQSIWAETVRIARALSCMSIVLERLGNRAAERQGEPPVLTSEDVKPFL